MRFLLSEWGHYYATTVHYVNLCYFYSILHAVEAPKIKRFLHGFREGATIATLPGLPQCQLTSWTCSSCNRQSRRGKTCTSREKWDQLNETDLPGGGGEQGPSSLAVEFTHSAGSLATESLLKACKGSAPVGSTLFPSVSTGAFPSATASVQQTKR